MTRLATALFFTLLALGRADTLILTNGASVTGSWVGLDAGQISFLVNNQLRMYPRSDVSSVTFGGKNPVASPLTGPDPSEGIPKAKGIGVVEPEKTGAIYLQDESGKLIPLEQARARLKGVATFHWEMEGARSPVPVKSGQKLLFVVRLANGKDPAFSLLVLETTKRGNRRAPFATNNYTPVALPFNVTKFGESSYGMRPAMELIAGEYAFARRNTNLFYCFSVVEATDPKAR